MSNGELQVACYLHALALARFPFKTRISLVLLLRSFWNAYTPEFNSLVDQKAFSSSCADLKFASTTRSAGLEDSATCPPTINLRAEPDAQTCY